MYTYWIPLVVFVACFEAYCILYVCRSHLSGVKTNLKKTNAAEAKTDKLRGRSTWPLGILHVPQHAT
jgi:hypothetical protein